MALPTKDLLGMRTMRAEDITLILDTAVEMKKFLLQDIKKTPHLQGKSILTLFYENSTRTRVSFEMASKFMSAAAANISASASSVAKGETLIDTGKTLDMMGTDVIIIRHPMTAAPHLLAKHVNASVINAGDGANEHPTQALLDMFTMRERYGSLDGLRVTIVGDILHSRVARSNIFGLRRMGAHVTVAGPATLLMPHIEDLGAQASTDVASAVRGADVVMALRIQKERQKSGLFPSLAEYSRIWGIDEDVQALAAPHALIMHPGPMNRGVEITSAVAESQESVINEQVRNGLAVRMAILFLLTRKGGQ